MNRNVSCLKHCRLFDDAGALAERLSSDWLIGLAERNPAMCKMLCDREKAPWLGLLPWSGEFSGKYITGAYYIYRLTGDEKLKDYICRFIAEILELTAPEHYFGVAPAGCRLTGAGADDPSLSGIVWDAWSCYHMMDGLYLWYTDTHDSSFLNAVERAAELLIARFYDQHISLLSMGTPEVNLSVYHIIAKLYADTGKQKYYRFAKQIEKDILSETPHNWLLAYSQGREFYACDTPRWERLHTVMGAASMAAATGEAHYLNALRHVYRSILKTDIHNTGGFSTDEWARNGKFTNGNIETCCVIAFMALSCELLSVSDSGQEQAAILDQLEISYYNAVLGYNSPTGRLCTYSTPMNGYRYPSTHQNGFQIRPGAPELNCCSANAARGVGELARWLLTGEGETLCLNYYGRSHLEADDGCIIEVKGDYPCTAQVEVRILPGKKYRRFGFRIPAWSSDTRVICAGKTEAVSGGYWWIDGAGETELTVKLCFDFTPRYLTGEEKLRGKTSVYRGPVLFGAECTALAALKHPIPAREIAAAAAFRSAAGAICLTLPCGVTLTDFYHLGQDGREYATWLDVSGRPGKSQTKSREGTPFL